MHVTVRGPIFFARLRHVLCFAVAAFLSTLICALAAQSLRGATPFGTHDFWLGLQNWWIGAVCRKLSR